MQLDDKIAIITGAGSGIGEAIAHLFAKEGAKVIISDIDEKGGNRVQKDIETLGRYATFMKIDITKEDEVERMVESTIKTFGKIDILVNNAGYYAFNDRVTDIKIKDWDLVHAVNLRGVFLGCRFVIPHMIKAGGGIIINTASESGITAKDILAAYTTSKAGVVMLTKQIAIDYSSENIRINAVCPGYVETKMVRESYAAKKNPELYKQSLIDLHPIGRMGTPEDIAQLFLFLATDNSSFITGTAISIDGGLSSGRRSGYNWLKSDQY